jgi:hypothetical protein
MTSTKDSQCLAYIRYVYNVKEITSVTRSQIIEILIEAEEMILGCKDGNARFSFVCNLTCFLSIVLYIKCKTTQQKTQLRHLLHLTSLNGMKRKSKMIATSKIICLTSKKKLMVDAKLKCSRGSLEHHLLIPL